MDKYGPGLDNYGMDEQPIKAYPTPRATPVTHGQTNMQTNNSINLERVYDFSNINDRLESLLVQCAGEGSGQEESPSKGSEPSCLLESLELFTNKFDREVLRLELILNKLQNTIQNG